MLGMLCACQAIDNSYVKWHVRWHVGIRMLASRRHAIMLMIQYERFEYDHLDSETFNVKGFAFSPESVLMYVTLVRA